jgi:hypothetical protein
MNQFLKFIYFGKNTEKLAHPVGSTVEMCQGARTYGRQI